MVGCQFTATAIAYQYQALHMHRTYAVQQYSHLPRDTLSTSSTDRQHLVAVVVRLCCTPTDELASTCPTFDRQTETNQMTR